MVLVAAMRPNRIYLAFFSSLLLVAVLIARQLLTFLNEEDPDSAVLHRDNISLKYPVIEENTDGLMWMVQVSYAVS